MSLFHFPARTSPHRASSTALLLAALLVPLLRGSPSPAHQVQEKIRGGESRSMTLELAAGDFLGLVVEQDRVDVVVELFDPQGRKLLRSDGPDFFWWEEEIALVAETSGPYRLVIHPFLKSAAPGLYRVRIDGPRAPLDLDRTRMEAVREMLAAHAIGARERQAERLGHLENALRIWRSLGDRRRQAETLHQTMEILGELGRTGEAAERFRQALALWEELDLPGQRAWTLLESSRPGKGFFQGEETRGHLEQALTLAPQAGSPFLEHRILCFGLGLFHEPRAAVPYLERSLQVARNARDRDLEMRSLYQLGYALEDLAEKQEALRLYEEALRISRELQADDVDTFQANVLNSLGHLYTSLGHREKAAGYLEQALELSRKSGDAVKEAAALNNLAVAYEKLDPAKARELYELSLAIALSTGSRQGQVMAMNNLAFVDLATGNPSEALQRSRSALPLATGDEGSESYVRQAMGIAHRKLGNLEASRRELETSLAISRRRQDRFRLSQVIPELARTERMAGDLPRALALLEEGVRLLESLRTEVVQEDLRATFLAARQDTYQLHVDTLMALDRAQPGRGYDAEALRASERARARTLLDILAEAAADVREGSPRYAALTQPQPLGLSEIQRDVLDGRALLLEYALGEERSYLWAVTPGALLSFELPPRAKIEETARRWYGALSMHPAEEGGAHAGETAEEARKAADELSAMLLGPVEGLLSGQPLLVVADGALQYLPFGALPAPGSLAARVRMPLIAGQEVVSLPSASVLAVQRRELAGRAAAPKTLAILADPVFQAGDARAAVLARRRGGDPGDLRGSEVDPRRLPRLRFSEKEAEAIAALVPEPERFKALGFAATRAVATGGKLADYRMIHFATHGLIDSRHPELSSLVLSLVDERGEPQNGFLRLHDIYNLELRADLVVLSACQTALGQEIRGEGLVGLTRGFMYAGAVRVLASLWSVDDRATSVLMERFYRHMISSRMSPAAALRQAQADMSREPRWSSPYYWAGFSLQGEWR